MAIFHFSTTFSTFHTTDGITDYTDFDLQFPREITYLRNCFLLYVLHYCTKCGAE